ncbi:type II toxin-antitoxin system PemK/MazF family toxin [soil metagenome]
MRRVTSGDRGRTFWADIETVDSSPGYTRPSLVIQNNAFNRSRISTVVTCALTTNLRRAGDPGNVLLYPGEANLPEQSVVNVSQIATVDQRRLRTRIGTLSPEHVREVLRGIDLVLQPKEVGR